MSEKLKPWIADDRYYFITLLVVVALISFALGRISGLGHTVAVPESHVSEPDVALIAAPSRSDDTLTIPSDMAGPDALVASVNGTRYYRQDCSGVARIDPDNLLYFPDEVRALAAGYTRAVGCF